MYSSLEHLESSFFDNVDDGTIKDCKSENEQQEGYIVSYRWPYVPSFDYA